MSYLIDDVLNRAKYIAGHATIANSRSFTPMVADGRTVGALIARHATATAGTIAMVAHDRRAAMTATTTERVKAGVNAGSVGAPRARWDKAGVEASAVKAATLEASIDVRTKPAAAAFQGIASLCEVLLRLTGLLPRIAKVLPRPIKLRWNSAAARS